MTVYFIIVGIVVFSFIGGVIWSAIEYHQERKERENCR